jgi:hypothetical protein
MRSNRASGRLPRSRTAAVGDGGGGACRHARRSWFRTILRFTFAPAVVPSLFFPTDELREPIDFLRFGDT